MIQRGLQVSILMALGGCTGAAGVVRDASTGEPVAGAVLQTSNSVWGFRDGQLVWDKSKISVTTSGPDGAFQFEVGGGTGLRVKASGYPPLDTSFCPHDTLVLLGGPYPGLSPNRRLVFADSLGPSDQDRVNPPALAGDLKLRAAGPAFGDGSRLRIEAEGGVNFVPGTGAIPPAPPLPYPRSVEVDFSKDCGWLFVSDGNTVVAVLEARSPSGRRDPGQPWVWSLQFTPLPMADDRTR